MSLAWSSRGVEFFPHGKRGERAQRLGHLFSCLYLQALTITLSTLIVKIMLAAIIIIIIILIVLE